MCVAGRSFAYIFFHRGMGGADTDFSIKADILSFFLPHALVQVHRDLPGGEGQMYSNRID